MRRLNTLYQRFNEESVSHSQITLWLQQFDSEDQPTALFLAGLIDYWGYQRVHFGLRTLHMRLMKQLVKDGFIFDLDSEDCYKSIDFSRSFCSKSGDLISYFYRKMNGMRSLDFSNLEALDGSQYNLSNRALVILDDYIGTAGQFLNTSYRKFYPELFNRYGKVYVATLIANNQAIQTFNEVNQGNYETLVNMECNLEEIDDPEEIENLRTSFTKIRPGQSQLIYTNREISLLDPESHLGIEQRTQIRDLISKYTHQNYCHGLFNLMSHTVFFFQCPNGAPEILWDWDCGVEKGGWHPLFPRVSDLSIYAHDGNISLQEQVYGKLWDEQ